MSVADVSVAAFSASYGDGGCGGGVFVAVKFHIATRYPQIYGTLELDKLSHKIAAYK